ncbi:hypothetical protein AXW67_36850 [Bradyrhizobium neotropicale]|uniref:Uncharacterized protein n=1 Tax=Bradyrhizobium neotropicale TaxID=1497615 RepID=A0A176ZHU9_9BRAD|nr:hypothetical protein AXW67_36850 [Bradyrhizobium neotropicale]
MLDRNNAIADCLLLVSEDSGSRKKSLQGKAYDDLGNFCSISSHPTLSTTRPSTLPDLNTSIALWMSEFSTRIWVTTASVPDNCSVVFEINMSDEAENAGTLTVMYARLATHPTVAPTSVRTIIIRR